MNLEKERELFEAWYDKAYLNTDIGYLMHNGQYSSRRKQHSWDAWLASASREGYKMVPNNLSSDTSDDIWDNLLNNRIVVNSDGDGFIPVSDFDLDVVYKAMIGACDEE